MPKFLDMAEFWKVFFACVFAGVGLALIVTHWPSSWVEFQTNLAHWLQTHIGE